MFLDKDNVELVSRPPNAIEGFKFCVRKRKRAVFMGTPTLKPTNIVGADAEAWLISSACIGRPQRSATCEAGARGGPVH